MATQKKTRLVRGSGDLLGQCVIMCQSDRLKVVAENIRRAMVANGFQGDLRIKVTLEAHRGRTRGKHRHNTTLTF